MKRPLLLVAFFAVTSSLFAQADAYFQQEVNYTIQVKLDDRNHTLSAYEEFEYINNSSNSLDNLIIHLWPNAYKNAKTAMSRQKMKQGDYFMLYAGQKDKGFIDSLDFKVDGQKTTWEYYEGYEDIALLHLPR